jgi:hypothetical protein
VTPNQSTQQERDMRNHRRGIVDGDANPYGERGRNRGEHSGRDCRMNRVESVSGKVVVITGGARGIGLATATALHQLGAKVAIGSSTSPTR